MNTLWFRRNGLILIILIALTVSLVWTYTSIQPKLVVEPVQELYLTVTPNYQIATKKNLTIWPEGTVFEQGRAAYFYAAQPEVRVTPTIEIFGLKHGQIKGIIHSKAVIQAVNDKSLIYWSAPIKELSDQTFVLSEGVSGQPNQAKFVATEVPLDVAAAHESATLISKELGFETVVLRIVVTSDIHVSGKANGGNIENRIVQTLPITMQQESFSIEKTVDAISKVSISQAPKKPSTMEFIKTIAKTYWQPISVDIVLVVFLLILIFRKKWAEAKSAVEHKRFKDWITEGSVAVNDRLNINILTLEGLVDLAIDLDRRVIYDPQIKKYFVLAEDILYVHDPESKKAITDNKQQLGKLLIDRHLIRPEQLETGLYYHQRVGSKLGESLIALGFIDETTLYSTLAAQQQISYFELDSKKEGIDGSWLDKMSLNRARALQVLPLGQRGDGKLVVACSEPAKEGVQAALQEMFDLEIIMVATRPSSIYEALERLESQERSKVSYKTVLSGTKSEPFERLSNEEWDAFTMSYYRGTVIHGLFLKATGLVDPAVLAQVPKEESATGWLVNRNSIQGEIANLMKGLDQLIAEMDWKYRQERKQPSLLELLQKSNYLTPEMVDWVNREQTLQKLSINEVLSRNYIASIETIKSASLLLDTLKSILNKSPVETV